MARPLHRLTARTVESVKQRGYYADGGGLYLQVSATLTKSWVFRFARDGKAREMGLGPLNAVSLAMARELAANCRAKLQLGQDPIEERSADREAARLKKARTVTFKSCAVSYIDAHRAGWKNSKHAQQWENTLETYAFPKLGTLSVSTIDTAAVLSVIEPIWVAKPETASRLRGRIELIIDWAKARGYRSGENPARWKGHLDKLLPARNKVAAVKHHPALPYAEIGEFIAALREQEGVSARALEFTILNASRTNEVIGAKWEEVDLDDKVWIIPAERMKGRKDMRQEHRVPLSAAAVAVLKQMQLMPQGAYVFPGRNSDKPLSNMSMLATLERMGRDDITVHGFRSTFRDWAAEMTSYPREVAEMALAHVVADKVEAAYRRGDLFEKRRRLMEEWAGFCSAVQKKAGKKIIPIRQGGKA